MVTALDTLIAADPKLCRVVCRALSTRLATTTDPAEQEALTYWIHRLELLAREVDLDSQPVFGTKK